MTMNMTQAPSLMQYQNQYPNEHTNEYHYQDQYRDGDAQQYQYEHERNQSNGSGSEFWPSHRGSTVLGPRAESALGRVDTLKGKGAMGMGPFQPPPPLSNSLPSVHEGNGLHNENVANVGGVAFSLFPPLEKGDHGKEV